MIFFLRFSPQSPRTFQLGPQEALCSPGPGLERQSPGDS